MRKAKILIILLTIFSIVSCEKNSLNLDNENLKLEIQKVSNFHGDFTNKIQNKYLDIDAERMNFKDLFSRLLETDSTNISFNDRKLSNQYFKIKIKQKNKEKPINKIVMEQILKHWNMNLVTKKNKTYKIKLVDSAKFQNYKTKSKDNLSKVVQTKDSIKLKNCDLSKLTEILNSEYSEEIIFNETSNRIDFNLEKESFLKLKIKMENHLGINFIDLNKDKLIYTIKNN